MKGSKGARPQLWMDDDPECRMGPFKRLEDVPPEFRLENREQQFEDEDIWSRYYEVKYSDMSESTQDKARWFAKTWKEHMAERGRHHAFARPEDIEAYLTNFSADRTMTTMYESYFAVLHSFYDWLWTHTDYPHAYNPVMMAAVEGGVAREIFDYRIGRQLRKRKERVGDGK